MVLLELLKEANFAISSSLLVLVLSSNQKVIVAFSIDCLLLWTPNCSIGSLLSLKPAVSVNFTAIFLKVVSDSIVSLVVPGISETIDLSKPKS
jgi:hypothetical protein